MRVRYAARARNDIDHIHQYITAHNPRAAAAVVRKIRAVGRSIGRYPKLGRPTQVADVRVIGVGRFPYVIYYRVGNRELTIIHIRDGRRDGPTPEDFQ